MSDTKDRGLSDEELQGLSGGAGATQDSTNTDSLSELNQEDSLSLQLQMERMTKAASTTSNILKKVSDTSSGIVSNLK